MDGWVYDSVRKPLDVFIQKGWHCSKAETKGEAFLQSDGVGKYLMQGSDKHLPLEHFSKECSVSGGAVHAPVAFPSKETTKWQAPTRQCSLSFVKSHPKVLEDKEDPPADDSTWKPRFESYRKPLARDEIYIHMTVKPRNKQELLQAIQAFWATVTPEKCNRYIGHLKKAIPKVIELNGETTQARYTWKQV